MNRPGQVSEDQRLAVVDLLQGDGIDQALVDVEDTRAMGLVVGHDHSCTAGVEDAVSIVAYHLDLDRRMESMEGEKLGLLAKSKDLVVEP